MTAVLLAPCHDEFRRPRSDYVRQFKEKAPEGELFFFEISSPIFFKVGDGPRNFEPRSSDEVDILAGSLGYNLFSKNAVKYKNECYIDPAARGLLATDHVILNHGQVTWTTPELAPPLLTTTPHQREDVSALDRFNVPRCPTRRVFSGLGVDMGNGHHIIIQCDVPGLFYLIAKKVVREMGKRRRYNVLPVSHGSVMSALLEERALTMRTDRPHALRG
ncbi:uncharacterized protein TNCV_3861291 [Trichonephila clavipes]|nr:uncharacterized protein TNCV_3861291 [Trichonephila clavipes]